jgi:lysophospholipase L1-like esterase
LDGVNPKAVVLLAGTNNLAAGESPADVARGVQSIVNVVRAKAPAAAVIVTGILPRDDNPSFTPLINATNAALAGLAAGDRVRFLEINERLLNARGKLIDGMLNSDKLHPTVRAYQVWADTLKPVLTQVLGLPVVEDRAPAPTGDPSKRRVVH